MLKLSHSALTDLYECFYSRGQTTTVKSTITKRGILYMEGSRTVYVEIVGFHTSLQ